MKPPGREAVLITPGALAAAMAAGEDILLLAVRGPDSSLQPPYGSAPRLPGAIDVGMPEVFAAPSSPDEGSRPLPDPGLLQDALRQLGLRGGMRVVVYDHDGNLIAARAWWVLRWAGIDGARMLDGGFAAWQAAGRPMEHWLPPPRRPGNVALTPGALPVLSADQAIGLARRGLLLDTRIASNYAGGSTAPGEAPRGHIPGARNLPAAQNLDADGYFRPLEELHARFKAFGMGEGSPVGVYCGAGVSAAHVVAALAMLGIAAPMYVGSWSAYASLPSRPVARGPEPG